MANENDQLSWDARGLLPAIVQDVVSGEVLTLAYVSRESLARTRDLGETVFFSRSRNEIWHKGETSGNIQKVETLTSDCDLDAVLIQVRASGPACHKGARSCFFEEVEGFLPVRPESLDGVLMDLERLIDERKIHRPEGSYTAKLFEKGRKRILQKVGEEATEIVVAGMGGDRQETICETADLLFHLLVALSEMEIPLKDIAAELRSRRK